MVRFDGPRLGRFARERLSRGRAMPVSLIAEAHRHMDRGGAGSKILLRP